MTPPSGATHTISAPLAVASGNRNGLLAALSRRAIDPNSWARLRLALDLSVLFAASAAAVFAAAAPQRGAVDLLLAAGAPLLITGLLRTRRAPDDRMGQTMLDTTAAVLAAISVATMFAIVVETVAGARQPLELPVRLWLFGCVYLGIARATLYSIHARALQANIATVPTLIVGAGVVGNHLVKRLLGDARYGLRPVGFLDSDPLPRHDADTTLPVLGGPDDLARAIAITGAAHVILAFSTEPDQVLVERVRECEALRVGVSLVPRLYESINERTTLEHVGGLPLLTLHSVDPRGWQFAIKHTIDRTVAFLALLALSPAMLTIALLVRLTSPGPILFRQRRVGRDGHGFDVLKFRTMRLEAPAPGAFELADGLAPGGVEGADRRTSIGRVLRELSLDELPQLVNVLKGDMSLVGPRPERPEYVRRFARDVAKYEDRHRVKSGITGWAQVHGLRGQTSIADRVEWDNWYIQNWSLRLDLRIILLTIAEVLRFRESG
ncbi:MAG: sugar transferase [Solirubrobacteraceae bacterium]